MTLAELERKVAHALNLIERDDYACFEDLAEDVAQDFEGDITDEQHYHIAELVEMWWLSQD